MDLTATSSDTGSAARTQRLLKTTCYYAAFVGLGLAAAILGPTLTGLAEHTGSSLRAISYLFTARSLGYLIGSFLGGRQYDHVAGHPLMAGSLFGLAAMMALAPVMPVLWLLTAVMLLFGIGEGTVDVGGNTMLVWVHRDGVGPFMNALHFFFGLGAFVSPIVIAWVVSTTGDINWAFWALALVMLPVVAGLLRLPSPAPQAASDHSGAGPANPVLVGLIVLLFFLYVGTEVSFGGWIYTYAVATGLATTTVAAYMTSVFWGSFTAGRLLSIPIATRFNPQIILLLDLLGCLAGLVTILLWSQSLAAMTLGIFVVGLGMASIFPTTLLFAGRRMTMTGSVTGWFFVGSSTGGMFLPWLIGQLFESQGHRITMVIMAIAIALALGAFALLSLYSARQPARSR